MRDARFEWTAKNSVCTASGPDFKVAVMLKASCDYLEVLRDERALEFFRIATTTRVWKANL